MNCPVSARIEIESILVTIQDAKTKDSKTVELNFDPHGFTVSVPSGECFVLDYSDCRLVVYKYGAHDGLNGKKIGHVSMK